MYVVEGLPTDYSSVWIAAIIMFGEYLLFLFLAAVASNLLMFESHSMPNEDDLADDVDVGPSAATVIVSSNKVISFNGTSDSILNTKINSTKETESDRKIIELAFEPIAFAFQNIQYKVKVNDGSLCIPPIKRYSNSS